MSEIEMVGYCVIGLILGAIILAWFFGWLDDHIV
jgi:hypothetical protein